MQKFLFYNKFIIFLYIRRALLCCTITKSSWKLRRCSRHTVNMEKLSSASPDTHTVIDLLQEAAPEEENV